MEHLHSSLFEQEHTRRFCNFPRAASASQQTLQITLVIPGLEKSESQWVLYSGNLPIRQTYRLHELSFFSFKNMWGSTTQNKRRNRSTRRKIGDTGDTLDAHRTVQAWRRTWPTASFPQNNILYQKTSLSLIWGINSSPNHNFIEAKYFWNWKLCVYLIEIILSKAANMLHCKSPDHYRQVKSVWNY